MSRTKINHAEPSTKCCYCHHGGGTVFHIDELLGKLLVAESKFCCLLMTVMVTNLHGNESPLKMVIRVHLNTLQGKSVG